MNLFPLNRGQFDFALPPKQLRKVILETKKQFKQTRSPGELCLEKFRADLKKSEFLMPIFVGWTKKVRAENLLASPEISLEKKKDLRRAIKKAEQLGIKCLIAHPVSAELQKTFLAFYKEFMLAKGYQSLLKEDYFQKNSQAKLYLIYIEDAEGNFCGGQIVNQISSEKISIHYKAVAENKLGYDFLLENRLYELAVNQGAKFIRYGKDFNVRGLGQQKSTLFYYKLRFGYRPFFASSLAVAYINLATISRQDFDYLLFISFENKPDIQRFQKPHFNIVLGQQNQSEIKDLINYLQKKYPLHVYDQKFNLIS